jgi:hypothetical protein
MLGHRASVHRGSEALRVSAHLDPKDIESVDRTVARNLRTASAIDAEAWINDEGRVVRLHQKIHFASDPDIEATLTLTDFKSPMPVNAPAAS